MIFSFRVVARQNYSRSPPTQKDQPPLSGSPSEIKNNTIVARNVGSIAVARSFTYEERH